MSDDEITLFNACTDLVSLKKCEAFPRHLLLTKRPGEWVAVQEFCLQIGVVSGEVPEHVFATWLPDPKANEAYVVLTFYDDESQWSMAAQYNRERLSAGGSATKTHPVIGAASVPQPASPAEDMAHR